MNAINENSVRPLIPPLNQSLGYLINGLARMMRTALETSLKPIGLSPTAWNVLMAIAESDGLSQTDIGRRTFLDGATVTRAIDFLEAKGCIERHRADKDRRVQFVVMTDAGRKLAVETAGLANTVNDSSTGNLSSSERREFEKTILRIVTYLIEQNNNGNHNGK
ncbi:MAG: winged helix-turn-helix transcriptional regulator [Calditrichaeota bacterium]|jgi:MarR family transcriptional regulator, transcriptional regulator for hemolysin|nr:winged helix-turn-helix transcriptional regulator [Calditrichota bacterium]MBT7788305.1 winged helix-turn-helix transcriptional regulator [Calditrichota bacterium]